MRGVAAALDRAEKSAGPTATPHLPRIQLWPLSRGSPDDAPALVLVHPAGASGLAYMQLANALGASCRVFALDDGVVSAGSQSAGGAFCGRDPLPRHAITNMP